MLYVNARGAAAKGVANAMMMAAVATLVAKLATTKKGSRREPFFSPELAVCARNVVNCAISLSRCQHLRIEGAVGSVPYGFEVRLRRFIETATVQRLGAAL